MSGHSKWSTIKRKKGAADAKRGKIFTKVIKEISVAVRDGGPDPDANPRLRTAITNAKGVNMPKDNVERAIKKASGGDGADFQEVSFEGYAPHGIAFFVECTTDNLNRTVSSIRAAFNKAGGSLGKNGSLEFLFERKGVFVISTETLSMSMEDLEMELIDSGADDFVEEDGEITVYTQFEDFGTMQHKLDELHIEPQSAELQRLPNDAVALPVNQAKKILQLVEKFEDDDDVQNVFHSLAMTDDLIAEIDTE